MRRRRDVRTGRFVKGGGHDRRGYRNGEIWWEVTGFDCSPDCVCSGFEVCLQLVERFTDGGGSAGPVWPIISCSSEDDAKAWMKKLCVFARTIKPEEDVERSEKYNGDPRLGDWLEEQGFVKYNHIVWGPPKEST